MTATMEGKLRRQMRRKLLGGGPVITTRKLLARVCTVLGLLFAVWSWLMIRAADWLDPEPTPAEPAPPCRRLRMRVRSTVRPASSSWTVQ